MWHRRLVEGFFGDPEGVHCGGHTAVEHHLGDYLGDLLFGYTDMEGALNMPPDQFWAVPQHSQCGDGAEAASLKVDRRPIVDLAIDNRIDQFHDLRRQLGHGRRRARISSGSVVAASEVSRSLSQVLGAVAGGQSCPLETSKFGCWGL